MSKMQQIPSNLKYYSLLLSLFSAGVVCITILYLSSNQDVLAPRHYQRCELKEKPILWHNLSNDTLVWHIAHYEHRDFPYGGPAIIMMMFHYYNKTLPSIWLRTCNDDYCDCLEPQWVPYGKVVSKIRKEVLYFFNAVFMIQPNTTAVYDTVDIYSNSNCTDSDPIIQDMPIYYKTNEKQIEFAVCLYKGIIAEDTSLLDVASWIEINRAIGVQHIMMYDQDIGPNIMQLLKNYEDENFVTLIDWKIHNPDFRIAYNGQLATANDCFFRYLRRAKYVLFIDLDELIIPHSTATLGDMMNFTSLSKLDHIAQYRFYNSFWHESPTLSLINDTNTELPIHFRRLKRTQNPPETIRYKNIISTETAARIGIHNVFSMKKGHKMYQVPEHVGLMHHYRTPDYARREEQLTDKVMSRYFDTVMKRLANNTLLVQ